MATIMGIDPGYGRCGWAIVTDRLTYIDCGVIETTPGDEGERLFTIYQSVGDLIALYQPQSCGLEKLFFSKNTKTALSVVQVIGVCKLILTQHAIPYSEYTPMQIKQSITGYGRSSKEQLSTMLRKILKCDTIHNYDDAFDAIAIALCHCLATPERSLLHQKV
ncbi:MAG TPA: crossover junction endodeoxyribonuclease RuvC [Spirochaetota bacterium]|nr:crossover junction endodeoxyribonuclease RuvC [Spirochaetota bacterium]HOF14504.1 crossover junction endodeoxyribonuclease RuvC [Spirochaetota bacterium]HOM86853.1 crossover junction endodeoxyribonuclease RuvC [Spirochaetota bacterium]HOR92354.1 crossover junction endodeoxyribonuclease RuvC [Spirochaetota bacterium]HOT18464.1 crossover junction endodeoxyribonuclease RuvC [Spirochaetota bacterium]